MKNKFSLENQFKGHSKNQMIWFITFHGKRNSRLMANNYGYMSLFRLSRLLSTVYRDIVLFFVFNLLNSKTDI